MTTTIRANVLQTPSRDSLVSLRGVVVVDDAGEIQAVYDESDPGNDEAIRLALAGSDEAIELPATTYLLPGLIDLHVHAPQWPQLGTGLDLPLERWLFEYTFRLEARFHDEDFAQLVWTDLVSTLLSHGTTTAVYYGPLHVRSTTSLAQTCVALGQRALVGRVAMDHPQGTPDWYRDESASVAVARSQESIEAITGLGSALVGPILTPRFTPACTDAALAGLGELASETGIHVQTHCSESDWHHAYSIDRFGRSDTQVLEDFGLLRPHTVLAHSNHMSDRDARLAADNRAGVAHCPLSNAYFANAVFPARRYLDAGLSVGLGTDIAGGRRPGLLSQCGDVVMLSRLLEDGTDARRSAGERGLSESRLSTLDSFWMATLGGAEVLGLPIGLLEPGRRFDAIAVDTRSTVGALRVWGDLDDDGRIFEKIVNLAAPTNITDVWGRRQAGRTSTGTHRVTTLGRRALTSCSCSTPVGSAGDAFLLAVTAPVHRAPTPPAGSRCIDKQVGRSHLPRTPGSGRQAVRRTGRWRLARSSRAPGAPLPASGGANRRGTGLEQAAEPTQHR